jgi:hypothetical protein
MILYLQGISEYGGGFPNEFLLYQQITTGAMSSLPPTFLGYFVVMVTCATTSIVYQLKQRELNLDLYNYRKYDFKYRKA